MFPLDTHFVQIFDLYQPLPSIEALIFFFFLTTCQNAIVWFSNSFNALGANAQVKEFRVKNLGGQIRQR